MERSNLDEGLLLKSQEGDIIINNQERVSWGLITQEMKKIGFIAGPMVVVIVAQLMLNVVSIMMVGHLGELALSSTALAISIAGVTGFSFLQGMASALETLCGQAFGAKQFKKIGTKTYTAMFSLFLVCLPISILWINIKQILIFFGQDPLIAHEAGIFITYLIPALFAYAPLNPLVRYFQSQSMIFPLLISSCCTITFHVFVTWFLVFKTTLANRGAAIGLGLSLWTNATILFCYMRFSPSCEKTRSPLTMDIFRGVKEFFYFAIPSALMICLEWWSYELIILSSGLLPNPQLETSVLSVCLNTIMTLYAIPYGLGAAVSTRVSNELGAGNSQKAKIAILSVLLLIFGEVIVVNTALYSCRNVVGYVFSSDLEVVQYVTRMTPLLCCTVFLDGIQAALTGIARGCGWQHIGAYVNLAAFYLCGIPIALTLSFWQNYKGRGLWIGIVAGALVQNSLLAIITFCTNWEKQAIKATERLSDEKTSSNNNLVC